MVNVVLFKLVDGSVAVEWQLWMVLLAGGVLFRLELVVLSLMMSLGLWIVARWCWLWVSVLLVGMWVVGVG